jgi:hypothetical protein
MTNIVIVDIDGTLSDASERAEKYLYKEPKDWDKFYDACGSDKPIQEIVDLVCALSDSYGIVFCTGRRRSTNDATRQWLRDNLKTFRYSRKQILSVGKWSEINDARFYIATEDYLFMPTMLEPGKIFFSNPIAWDKVTNENYKYLRFVLEEIVKNNVTLAVREVKDNASIRKGTNP